MFQHLICENSCYIIFKILSFHWLQMKKQRQKEFSVVSIAVIFRNIALTHKSIITCAEREFANCQTAISMILQCQYISLDNPTHRDC